MKHLEPAARAQGAMKRCKDQLPGNLLSEEEPTFSEPWQAQAFALAVHLIDSGHISWSEWSATLGEEIANASSNGIHEDGSEYYLLWLRTLERLASDKALAPAREVETLAQAWKQAYLSTPHGEPVALSGV